MSPIYYQGRWAVVTGASSGLGRRIAARLADRGMSLVLTGRNQSRLDETAQAIRSTAPRVEVETVAANLGAREGISALLDHVGDRPIEVLVNNVAKLIGETTPSTRALESARYLDEHFLQKGRLGVASGQGFYRYPSPASRQSSGRSICER